MKDFDDELEAELRRDRQRAQPDAPRKTLRWAIVMVGACVAVSVVVGSLMPGAPRSAPVRASVTSTSAAVAVPAPRRVPSAAANQLKYTADASGHFYVDATVNGAPLRFLVDTGATFVALSPDDAAAASLSLQTLAFTEVTSTANGETHVARTTLRSVRLGQLEVGDVSAVVMERPMAISLLGMSFLSRVDGYSIRDGILTIEW